MIDPQHGPRRVRSVGLLTALLVLLAILLPGVATAQAPFGPYAQTLTFEVADLSPQIITDSSGSTLRIQGTFTNTGALPIDDLDVRFHRGDPLADTAALQAELADPSQPAAEITEPTPLPVPGDVVGPGAAVPFDLSVDLLESGLRTPGPGVYPLMVNINGQLVNGPSRQEARIGELHLLVTVLSLPGQPAPVIPEPLQVSTVRTLVDVPHLGLAGVFLNDDLAAAVAPGGRLDIALTALEDIPEQWAPTLVLDPMLVDELHRMAQGYRVLADPTAAQPALTPADLPGTTDGGAAEPSALPSTSSGASSSTSASSSVAASSSATAPSPTTAPDPTTTQLSNSGAEATGQDPTEPSAAEQVSGTEPAPSTDSGPSSLITAGSTAPTGSLPTDLLSPTVGEEPSISPEPAVESATELPGTVAGTGDVTARLFLDRLLTLTGRLDTVVLPYGNPDAVALIGAGMTGTLQALAERSRDVASRLLPGSVRTDVAVPPGGWTDEATLGGLQTAGYTSAIVRSGTVLSEVGARAVLTTAGWPMPAVIAGAGDTRWWSDLFTSGSAPAARLNAEIAGMVLHAGQGPVVGPLVLLDQTAIGAGPAGPSVAQTLVEAGLITGAPLPAIDPAAPAASVALPDDERALLLDRSYLREVDTVRAEVPAVAAALSSAGGNAPDPAALFDPLQRLHPTLYSTALRTDPTPAGQILSSIRGTLDLLRSGVALRFSTSYSLASSSSPLIFTVQNQLPYVAQLRVRIEGGSAVGLEITDNPVHSFPPGRTETVTLTSQVARSGSFSVDVGLETADGVVWSTARPVTVASSAYGFVTVLIIVIAGVVLVVMVVFRIAQRIRQRGRPDPEVLALTESGDNLQDPDTSENVERTRNGRRPAGRDQGPDQPIADAPTGPPTAPPTTEPPTTEPPTTEPPTTEPPTTEPPQEQR